MHKIFRLLMDQANDGTGGGGGGGSSGASGGNSLLTTSAGGSKAAAGSGDAGASSGAAANKSAGDSGANNGSQGGAAADWRSQLPQELQEDANIKKFTSISALASSYLNAQKLIGADKIPVPGKHATDEDWMNAYKKLGLPETPDKYEVKFKEQVSVDQEFSKQFKETAYKAGVLPKQAQALADWFSDINLQSETKYAEEMKAQYEKNVKALQTEWGNAFPLNVARANKVLDEIAKEDKDYFNSIGLGGNDKFIRFLAKVGETLYGEDKIVGEEGGVGAMSPKELDMEIGKLRAEPAYMDKTHPNHKRIVDEVKGLYEKRYPAKQS